MRLLLALALIPLAGCLAEPEGCTRLPQSGLVESISGRDVQVHLDDGEPAVLHLPEAIRFEDAARCHDGTAADVRVGDALSFEVDAWAESYPVQGWPDRVVVHR